MTELPEKALKLLALALNAGAEQGEWEAAAIKAVACMRKDGVPVQFFEPHRPNVRDESRDAEWDQEYPGFIMPFGKFKGFRISDLPDWYFVWLATQVTLRDPLKGAVNREIRLRTRGKS